MSELIDNRAQRVRTLKGIIKRLHAGDAPDAVRASLKELVCQTDYSEVMAHGAGTHRRWHAVKRFRHVATPLASHPGSS